MTHATLSHSTFQRYWPVTKRAKYLRQIVKALKFKSDYNMLLRMSDRALADIGLTRGDVLQPLRHSANWERTI